MTYTVGEVAALAGISKRTLHHYDEIGLLRPSGRSRAGYRLYEKADLRRLQEVLTFRELGFSLDEIRSAVTDPTYDRGEALRRQRVLLARQLEHLETLVLSIDEAIGAHEKGIEMSGEDMLEVFGDFDPKQYEAEVEERWSGPALDESLRRTSRYTKEQWNEIGAESETIAERFADLHRTGTEPTTEEAMAIAESHRLHIDRWFYPCSPEMHAGLGEMYVLDPRFSEYWDKYHAGLTPFVRDAIVANAQR